MVHDWDEEEEPVPPNQPEEFKQLKRLQGLKKVQQKRNDTEGPNLNIPPNMAHNFDSKNVMMMRNKELQIEMLKLQKALKQQPKLQPPQKSPSPKIANQAD
jgi:hypothetical protein